MYCQRGELSACLLRAEASARMAQYEAMKKEAPTVPVETDTGASSSEVVVVMDHEALDVKEYAHLLERAAALREKIGPLPGAMRTDVPTATT